MKKNILQYLEQTAKKYANKTVFADINREVTYSEFIENSKKIGSSLSNTEKMNQPIAILLDKSVACLEAMMGVLYSGNFYTILDVKSPNERLASILDTLNPVAIITDKKNEAKAKEIAAENQRIYTYEQMTEIDIQQERLEKIRSKTQIQCIFYLRQVQQVFQKEQ
jgi:acyl-CoA synthetase (AMP-forming)/AMP-acid ligase II